MKKDKGYISMIYDYSDVQDAMGEAITKIGKYKKPVFLQIGDIFMYIEPTMTIEEMWKSYEQRLRMQNIVLNQKTNKYER